MSEHDEQSALFRCMELNTAMHPELALAFAIPNGGHRHVAVAAKMKQEGVRAGVPDILLPVARGGYNGLFLELKWGRNKPDANQLWWHEQLRAQGYRVEVCWGWQIAWDIIMGYLNAVCTN